MSKPTVINPIEVELRQYDDERVAIVAGGKQFESSVYEFDLYYMRNHDIFGDGAPVFRGIKVRSRQSGELAAAFGTRI